MRFQTTACEPHGNAVLSLQHHAGCGIDILQREGKPVIERRQQSGKRLIGGRRRHEFAQIDIGVLQVKALDRDGIVKQGNGIETHFKRADVIAGTLVDDIRAPHDQRPRGESQIFDSQ